MWSLNIIRLLTVIMEVWANGARIVCATNENPWWWHFGAETCRSWHLIWSVFWGALYYVPMSAVFLVYTDMKWLFFMCFYLAFCRFIGLCLFISCLLHCCEILRSHWSDWDACSAFVVMPFVSLTMYRLPEHRAVSVYPEDGRSISSRRPHSVTTHKITIPLVVFFLLSVLWRLFLFCILYFSVLLSRY